MKSKMYIREGVEVTDADGMSVPGRGIEMMGQQTISPEVFRA